MLIDSGVWPGVSRISNVTPCSSAPSSDPVAVGERDDRELGPARRGTPVADGRPGPLGELEVPGQEVGMEVGLQDLHDRETVLGGVGEVRVDVALRVHDHRPSRAGVTDQVAGVRQALQVVLAEEHRRTWFVVHAPSTYTPRGIIPHAASTGSRCPVRRACGGRASGGNVAARLHRFARGVDQYPLGYSHVFAGARSRSVDTIPDSTLPVEHEPSPDPDERALFSRLAATMARHRRAVILVWLVVTLAAAPLAITLTKALSGAGWDAKGSTAEQVRMELRRDFPALGAENPIVVYRQGTPIAEDPAGLRALEAELATGPRVVSVADPLAMPPEAGMISQDGLTALVPVEQQIERGQGPSRGCRRARPLRRRVDHR